MAFIRRKVLPDGREVRQVVESRRVGGKPRQTILATLWGRGSLSDERPDSLARAALGGPDAARWTDRAQWLELVSAETGLP